MTASEPSTKTLNLIFFAPIAVGARVRLVHVLQRGGGLFGSSEGSVFPMPIVVDESTGVVYCYSTLQPLICPEPLGFVGGSGCEVARTEVGRVRACVVGSQAGDLSVLCTTLVVDLDPTT
ncbi:MAG: hypothetical protein H6721_07350 [Sandaracinus sp.]|nr:hypothetical protein [Sandaracinus sp.]MCB9620036.1 hypothetical protein [Sandaracinus sp.]MCB9631936.1 hypothetical protein [Sandaracinus sp.]